MHGHWRWGSNTVPLEKGTETNHGGRVELAIGEGSNTVPLEKGTETSRRWPLRASR